MEAFKITKCFLQGTICVCVCVYVCVCVCTCVYVDASGSRYSISILVEVYRRHLSCDIFCVTDFISKSRAVFSDLARYITPARRDILSRHIFIPDEVPDLENEKKKRNYKKMDELDT